jgi:hypothetical protein
MVMQSSGFGAALATAPVSAPVGFFGQVILNFRACHSVDGTEAGGGIIGSIIVAFVE